jgi:hypothetical protein
MDQINKFHVIIPVLFSPGEGSSFLSFHRGDLILLEEGSTGETVQNSGWCVGRCDRTGEKGDFPAETVYVLPTLSKPPSDILVCISIRSALFRLSA